MANQPIKNLNEKAVPANGDDFIIDDNVANETKKIGYDNLKAALNADLSFVDTVGTIDSAVAHANGAVISGQSIIFQSATNAVPGLINTTTQNLFGRKRFAEETVDYGAQWNCLEGSITPVNTVDSANDFLSGVEGRAEGTTAFATGQLQGVLGFSGSGTNSGNISSMTGVYGWSQSHSAYTGQVGYIIGLQAYARKLDAYTGTGVYGTQSQIQSEVAATNVGVLFEGSSAVAGAGSFDQVFGVRISSLQGGTSKIGFYCVVPGSHNHLMDTHLHTQSLLKFQDSDDSNWVAFKAPATIASDITWTLPNADGSSGHVLTTNGSGTLSWSAVASSTNSFATINCPSGTDPVADSTTDTLNLTVGTTGTDFNITGDSATDSIAFNIPDAGEAARGVLNFSGTQQDLGGKKAFNLDVTSITANEFNLQGISTLTLAGNSAANSGINAGVLGTFSKLDSFNTTGIGYLAGGYFAASNAGGTMTNTYLAGIVAGATYAGTSTVSRIYGGNFSITTSAASTINQAFGVQVSISNSLGGTITHAQGISFDIVAVGTITNAYGLRFEAGAMSGATNAYALSVEDTSIRVRVPKVEGYTGILDLVSDTSSPGRVRLGEADIFQIRNTGGTRNVDIAQYGIQTIFNQRASGQSMALGIVPEDHDGTDNVFFAAYAKASGTIDALTNTEYCAFGYNQATGDYEIASINSGTGVLRDMRFYMLGDTDQFMLHTNGNVTVQAFATFDNTGFFTLDNLKLDGNTISSTSSNIVVEPNNDQLMLNGYFTQTHTQAGSNSLTISPLNSFSNDITAAGNITDSGYVGVISSMDFDIADAGFDITGGAGDYPNLMGGLFSANQLGSGDVDWMVGAAGTSTNELGGTTTRATGVASDVANAGLGTITHAEAFAVVSVSNDGGGTITNAYAYRLATGVLTATNKFGVSIEDASADSRFVGQIYSPTATLTDAASIDWNCDGQQKAKVTLGGNRTLNAPTNMLDGATYVLRVIQDGTGNRTLTWNAVYKFAGGTDPTLSTGAGAIDIFKFESDGTNMYCTSQQLALA